MKKILQDIGVVGISQILIRASGIILLPILTKTLGAYGYGLWTQARVTIGLAVPILLLGLHSAVSRFFPSKDLESIGKDFSSLMFIVSPLIFSFSIFLFIYPNLLANLIFEGNDFIVRFVALITFVWTFDKLFFRVFQGFREMKKYALIRVVTKYAELGSASYLVLNGYGLFGALSAVLIIRSGIFLILTINLAKKLGVYKPNISRTKEYLKYGVPSVPSIVSFWIINTSDRYLIAFFLGVTSVGYYNPAYVLGMTLASLLAGTVSLALKPTLSFHYDEGNIETVKQIIKLTMKYMFTLVIPFFFGILLFHEEVMRLLTTPKIASEASFIAIFLSINGMIFILYRVFQIILVLEKKTKTMGGVKTTAALINFGGNLLLIPMIGITGAAITTMISFSFISAIYILISKKYLSLGIRFVNYLRILIASLLMYLCILPIRELTDLYFIYIILIGIGSYFLFLFLLGGIKEEEYKYIISSITKK